LLLGVVRDGALAAVVPLPALKSALRTQLSVPRCIMALVSIAPDPDADPAGDPVRRNAIELFRYDWNMSNKADYGIDWPEIDYARAEELYRELVENADPDE
jgi:vacuolar-type H+-ATPase catalytic subunit A/Vma1